MTETRDLPLSAFTIKEKKPSEPFGQVANPPLSGDSDEQVLLLRATLPSDIPTYAVVTAATIKLRNRESMPGSHTLTLRRNTAAVRANVKYNNAPTFSGTATATLTKSGASPDTLWSFTTASGGSVAADVQGFLAGSFPNYGWRLSQDASAVRRFWGAVAAKFQPVLSLTYAIPGEPPTDLMPTGGAVSVPKPILTFSVPPGTTAIQVQVDPASNPVTAWESDEVAAVSGVLNLADTDYPGLANLAATTWRARYLHADTGWSDYSDWYDFSRVDQPALTITSPDATPGDGTPPVAWTFTGQAAWRARLLDASGTVLSDSLEQSGTDLGWQPTRGLTSTNRTGIIEVSARDAVVRVATPGTSTWVKTTLPVTFTPSQALAPFSDFRIMQVADSPIMLLNAERAEGVPDEVVVYRQTGEGVEEQVARVVGLDHFDGEVFEYADPTAPPNVVSVYRIVPVTDGVVGDVGPSMTVVPRCIGLWLIDTEDLRAAMLLGDDAGSWDIAELASEHQPTNGEPLRRRMFRLPPRGDHVGDIVDTQFATADETMATLDAFAAADSDHIYRLVAGHENVAVRAHGIFHRPTPRSSVEQRHALGGWSFRVTRTV